MDELLLGKPEPLPETSGVTSAPEEEKPRAKKSRRTKAERFPKNLMILIEKEIIPDYLVPGHGTTREGRNWMFFGSLEAGTNNALIYTLLANCRAQGLDPED